MRTSLVWHELLVKGHIEIEFPSRRVPSIIAEGKCPVTAGFVYRNVGQGQTRDVLIIGEDYIRAHTTMKYSDYSGWIIILDMEPWNDAQASPRKKKKRDSFPQIPTWLEGHVKERKQKRLPTVTLFSSAR